MFYRCNSIQSYFKIDLFRVVRSFRIRVLLWIVPVALGAGTAHAQSWQTLARLPEIINSSFFFNSDTGFVGSGATVGAPNSRLVPINIYRTTDGGLSWAAMSVPPNVQGSVSSIFMVDQKNGWASVLPQSSDSYDRLWQTTDGGMTWTAMSTTGTGTCVYQTSRALILTDLDLNFNEGGISTDHGVTFTNTFQGSTNCIGFLNDTDGIITVFRDGPWERTTDGGLTWNDLPLRQESWGIGPVRGTSTYYCAGEALPTVVTKSTDKGLTWTSRHSFAFETSGDIHAVDSQTLYVQVNSNLAPNLTTGILRSTDGGVSWMNLGGPQNFNDSRFTVIPIPCGSVIFAFDTGGGAFKLTDLFNGSEATLSLSTESEVIESSCAAVDTAIPFVIEGCSPTSPRLDSVWLTGSSAFSISDSRTTPRSVASNDSILIGFRGTPGADTAELHIHYDLGFGVQDTTVLLIGSVTSPFFTQPAQLHRESASAYAGQLDSLTLGVDISTQINLDSLWPYIANIQATYTWDSSVAKHYEYLPPSGWSLISLASHGDAVNFEIQNAFGTLPTQPLDLGTALFTPNTGQLLTSWVELPSLVIDVGNEPLSLCVTDNEDNHWALKTLGALSGVDPLIQPVSQDGEEIVAYPNPAGDELFVRTTNPSGTQIVIYDAIGRPVATGNEIASSTASIDIHSLARGSYTLVCHIGDHTITRNISKVQ